MKTDNTAAWEDAVRWLRSQSDQQELVCACFFDDPLLDAAKRYYQSTEWNSVKDFLPQKPGDALDIGAGRGISSYALSRDGWNTTALEPNKSDLVGSGAIRNLARDSMLKIKVVEKWGERLPFDSGSFDLVHGRQVLHHANDLIQLCGEIGRVLKPGGVFIATREHVINSDKDLDEFYRLHPLHFKYGGEYAYKLGDYKKAIKTGGIKMTKVLNPYQSDINLYPETRDMIKERIIRKIKLPVPETFLNLVLYMVGLLDKTPGRLYSFIGIKS